MAYYRRVGDVPPSPYYRNAVGDEWPGAVERVLGVEYFDELAVMVDTFRPLALGEGGTAVDDGRYTRTWSGRGPST